MGVDHRFLPAFFFENILFVLFDRDNAGPLMKPEEQGRGHSIPW